jgi:hypothetical protein
MDVDVQAFCSWLVVHADEVVGKSGSWFDAPLARWLSEQAGRLYGVDGNRYGWACADACSWRVLPRWAEAFSLWADRSFPHLMTGEQAFLLLAQIEHTIGVH